VSSAPFQLAPLDATHDRTTFNSASEPLDRYLREHVTQDVRRRVAACFVALAEGQRIAGYYTLASASLLLADLPANTGKKLPRYPTVPAVRMGRLAVDQGFKGQGLGGALLADALDRAARSEIAAYALMVDAKDEAADGLLPASWIYRFARLSADAVPAPGNRSFPSENVICPSRPWYAVLSPPESGAPLSLEPARPHRFLGCAQYVAAGS
jgi:GNAT superfamily N-acetyltransferase